MSHQNLLSQLSCLQVYAIITTVTIHIRLVPNTDSLQGGTGNPHVQ